MTHNRSMSHGNLLLTSVLIIIEALMRSKCLVLTEFTGEDTRSNLLLTCNFVFAAIPSLRARDCSKNEKEALNYLFLLIPLLNVLIPFFWKSFSLVWSADTIAFFLMYTWKVP